MLSVDYDNESIAFFNLFVSYHKIVTGGIENGLCSTN